MHQIKRILSMLLIIAVTFTSIYLSDNYSSHAAGVNEETYYFKEAGYKSWSKTTNPEAIPVGLTSGSNANAAFVFTTVPGATYYYKNRSYYSWKKNY